MSKSMIIMVSGAFIILIVVIGALLLAKGGSKAPTITSSPAPSANPTNSANIIKEFTVEGGDFFFNPNQIKVKKGDTVKITFNNSNGMHDFVIHEFNVRTKIIKNGETTTVQFAAAKSGSFKYYCSVG